MALAIIPLRTKVWKDSWLNTLNMKIYIYKKSYEKKGVHIYVNPFVVDARFVLGVSSQELLQAFGFICDSVTSQWH